MILIAISWIYILFSTINFGLLFNKTIQQKNTNLVITSILGLFSITILASIWAIFGRINIEFHSFLLLLNGILFFIFKTEILSIYTSFISDFKLLTVSLKSFLIIITILIIAQCATKPFIVDNESYYIQTIKWLNEYGFVKGLANLHIFFAQSSGWHIAQSAFSFSFLYKNFNDLSGFCLLLGNIFSVFKLNTYFKSNKKAHLILAFPLLLNVLLFKFISSPSPDIPTYIFTFIIFYYLIIEQKNVVHNFYIITILSLFIFYCKITSVVLLFLPLYILITNFKELIPKIKPIIILSFLVLSLFIIKNTILIGIQFYPIYNHQFLNLNYAVPNDLIEFMFYGTRIDGFYITENNFQTLSYMAIVKKWFFNSLIDSVFNLLTIITLLVSPFFIYNFYNKKSYWIIYIISIIQMIFMFLSSPQYRYFIHFIFFLDFMILAVFIKNKKMIVVSIYSVLLLSAVVLFIPLKINKLTTNKLMNSNTTFNINNIVFPYSNSKLNATFYKEKLGDLNYNSINDDYFIWATGNGNLPCINKYQLEFINKNYHYIPQLQTSNLKDGFYSKKTNSNE